MNKRKKTLFTVAVVLGCASGMVQAKNLTGAGSTFAYPIYARWADSYRKLTGTGLNYQSIGSGGGIKQIEAKTVNFGASDMPLTLPDLRARHLVQFPALTGGVVISFNLRGIRPGTLRFDGPVLADIYLGKIRKWNNSRIVALNPGIHLPDQDIRVIHRADGSGTTFIFTNYLSKVSPEWREKVGNNTAVAWPVGAGGKGNEGVSSYIGRIPGAIGYVEYAYVLQNHMNYAALRNYDGKYVEPNSKTFQSAAAGVHWSKANGFCEILTNEPGAESYPITGATFILMLQVQDKPEEGREVLKFFKWAYAYGGAEAISLDYVPMPGNAVRAIEDSWRDIKDQGGKPIFP
ncbi:MAG TPA: phosphate ABC transporter substrate-binding protein PstS [Burkholderiales bacterium]|nr:phosphate ABC transporter substrate-binding protein PstS [Burkholderiales bacterium]